MNEDWPSNLASRGWVVLHDAEPSRLDMWFQSRTAPMRLSPSSESSKNPWSLSERFGLEQFPWHTDGAISVDPPRYLALWPDEVDSNVAPTELLDPANHSSAAALVGLRRAVWTFEDRSGAKKMRSAMEWRRGVPLLRWDDRFNWY